MHRPSPLRTLWLRPAIFSLLLCFGGASLHISMPPEMSARSAVKQRHVFTGEVVGVSDGDTITVLVNREARKVRLYGIDTPERKQAFGMKAKQFTSSLAFGKNVTVTVMNKDRYGRYVAIVRLDDGRILNRELVRHGYAWWYSSYAPKDKELQALEHEARLHKRELWSDPKPIAPWEFRRL